MKTKLNDLLKEKKTTVKEAFKIFDELEPATVDFMIGQWKGSSIYTENQLDGELEETGWYGKKFITLEEVHPLLYFTEDGKGIFSVNPTSLMGKTKEEKKKFSSKEPTKKSRARLRATEYRGKLCATMIYDELAILDIFVKIDENKALGVMDLKEDRTPFFFLLERDDHSTLKLEI
ncbi:DUF4334 domain-containing protein [Myroides odoratus]|uniref:DUF4334 domain-containing protein n=1 Tax=Myroides odoratus TaxID=256 RepID=UPI003341B0FA